MRLQRSNFFGIRKEVATTKLNLVKMQLVHFKVSFDSKYNWDDICQKLFKEKWLCVFEESDGNPHVHFQGYTEIKQFDKETKSIFEKHYKKDICPGARPCKRAKKEIDEVGFQYITKQLKDAMSPRILSKAGFSDEEIEVLIEKSAKHVAALKQDCSHVLLAMHFSPEESPKTVSWKMFLELCKWRDENQKQINGREKLVIWNAMRKHNQKTTEWEKYIFEKLGI